MVGVTAAGDQVLVEATGPSSAPSLAALRRDLNAAGLSGPSVRVSPSPSQLPAFAQNPATAQ